MREERCFFPFGLGLVVYLLRFGRFLYLADDLAITDCHDERIDSRSVWQRKDVLTFQPLVGGVREVLRHNRSCNHASNTDLSLRRNQRNRSLLAVIVGSHQQSAHFGVVVFHRATQIRPLRCKTRSRQQHKSQECKENCSRCNWFGRGLDVTVHKISFHFFSQGG